MRQYDPIPLQESPAERWIRRGVYILLAALALALLSIFAAESRGADANEPPQAQVAKVEITPSTMPVEPGMPAPPPTVKVTVPIPPPQFDGDKWTPTNVAIFFGWLISAAAAGFAVYEVIKAKFGVSAIRDQVNVQGEVQRQQLIREGTGSGSRPPGDQP